jgi:hypothetical protein
MVEITQESIDAALAETERLSRELNITNADHIALWLEANREDSSIGWMACRIIEAVEAVVAAAEQAEREACARVAEKWIEPVMATDHENATYRSIATAIRARGSQG